MKNTMIWSCCFLLMNACTAQTNESAKSDVWQPEEHEQQIDALVKQYTDLDIFSGVVTVAVKGEPVYNKAFGLANREEKIPNTTNTCFDIGSMNKGFTKVVILNLVNEGKLKLSDPLGKFLEGFPEKAARKITVEHLLNHESGYGDYHTPDYFDAPKSEKTIAQKTERISKLPLLFEPGTEQEYSNAGYVLLGAIIEKVTGKSYYDAVEERIVKPLKMDRTYLRDKYTVPERAIGYYKNVKGELMSNEDFEELPSPDGGFYSNTEDMLKFYRAYHYGDQLWNEAARKKDDMYDFYQENRNSGGAMTHAGGFEGANTVHYEILRDEISVMVFANMDEPVAERLGGGILAIIRGQKPEKPSLPAGQAVYRAFTEKGSGYVVEHFVELTKNFHPTDPKDLILNQVGYELLFSGDVNKALEAFRINTEMFPDVANVWDSYGEAWLEKGDREKAMEAYQKALEINPEFPTALEKVKELSENHN